MSGSTTDSIDIAPPCDACFSDCDCCPYLDTEQGTEQHQAECHSHRVCDGCQYCDRHDEEAARSHAWMRGMSKGAVTGVMSEEDKQDMRDAGRGHLV